MTVIGSRQPAIDDLPTLPHYLRPGLRLVFIGYNPGIDSARAGHYYARPGNVFWKQLSASGLVARAVSPFDDSTLMDEAGIGFTDLCERPTLRAQHLTRDEHRAGAQRLLAELVEYRPRIAVFSGKGIYQLFARHALGIAPSELANRPYGEQPERIGRAQSTVDNRPVTIPWVIPSSSGLASKWHALRLALLRELATAVAADEG
jgi:TDG/mug DNA glycosylase family protein